VHVAVTLLYLAGVVLLLLASLGVPARVSLALLGAACLALGFTLPAIVAGVGS
jgi:hypothetical protein